MKKKFKKIVPSDGSLQFNVTILLYRVKNEVTQNLFKLGVVVAHIIVSHLVQKSGQLEDWIKSYGQKIVILEQFLKMATKRQSFGHNFWSNYPIDLIFSPYVLQCYGPQPCQVWTHLE